MPSTLQNGAHSSNTEVMKTYPDVTPLLKAKMERRRELARLSFEEKIEIVNKWRGAFTADSPY